MYLNILDASDRIFIGYCKTYLNGSLLDYCFAAHEEEGWADIYLRDDSGQFLLNAEKTEVIRKRLHGNVRIRCREDAPLDICEQFVAKRQVGASLRILAMESI